ncbi:unnamed protein product, partial [marine sediment metagenome]
MHWIISILALILLVGLEFYALKQKIDGIALSVIALIIGGIVGVNLKDLINIISI